MSGLETAIRTALERSDRTDPQIRQRVYQWARQTLETGLHKRGISDPQVFARQQQLLARLIDTIELEEHRRWNAPVEPVPVAAPPPHVDAEPRQAAPDVFSEPSSRAAPAGDVEAVSLRADAVDLRAEPDPARREPVAAEPARKKPARPRRRERRRRGFLAQLLIWLVTLGVIAGAGWWFYRSGAMRDVAQEAIRGAEQFVSSRRPSGPDLAALNSRNGFGEGWREIFTPAQVTLLRPGPDARVEAAATARDGARILSASAGERGDIAIEVPAELLRDMAGGDSTIALGLQSASATPVQVSVRCDFGSLGACSRHRFTVSAERQEALLHVALEPRLAPNQPGRVLVNTAIGGENGALLLHSVRVLPGQ